jgi:conjugative transfer signal peptidase TraF
MPDPRVIAVARWSEELRRQRRRGRTRAALVVAAALAPAALVGTLLSPPRLLLVWNASASAPTGMYLILEPAELQHGEMVVARPPDDAARLAASRGYLPAGVPLVKQVAALGGDRVCAIGESIFVDGQAVARRLPEDRLGRRLPWWTGCRNLRRGELLLLMGPVPGSFDGRYFGVSDGADILGRARLIWRG